MTELLIANITIARVAEQKRNQQQFETKSSSIISKKSLQWSFSTPDVQPRRDRNEKRDAVNDSRLDNAVLKIRIFRTKLKVFFKGLDHNSNNHIDDHKHDEKDEKIMPKECGIVIDEKLIVEVACSEEST